MIADLRCREYVFLSGEVRADRDENFWRYPNGGVERVDKISGVDERIVDRFLVSSSLETSELRGVGIDQPRTSSRVRSEGFRWLVWCQSSGKCGQRVNEQNGCYLLPQRMQ